MVDIILTVPSGKAQLVMDAVADTYPIPMVHETPGDLTSPMVPEFTKQVWVKERLRRVLIDAVKTYQRKLAAAAIQPDDTVVT